MRHSLRPSRLVVPALLLALALACGSPAPAVAQDGHEGHNHGGEGPTVAGVVNPRGVTETPSFQMAAVMIRNQLLVFLDNPDTNEPVSDAAIEMTANDRTIKLSPRGDGAYVAEGWRPRVGHNALMFFVDDSGTADLLNIGLDVPEPTAEPAATPAAAAGGLRGKTALLIAVPAALLLGLQVSVVVTRATRRRRNSEAPDSGGSMPQPLQT